MFWKFANTAENQDGEGDQPAAGSRFAQYALASREARQPDLRPPAGQAGCRPECPLRFGFTYGANEAGEYVVPLLGVANYNVQVEQKGFQNAAAQDIRLQVDEHRELDFKLSPATVETTVDVSATPVAIQTSDATLGQVITSQQVADLPLNGRDFVQLAHRRRYCDTNSCGELMYAVRRTGPRRI